MSTSNTTIIDFPAEYQIPEFKLQRTVQGLRGTCVAFAAAGLLNYLFQKQNKHFSPQYIYARCKQEDNNTNDGTGIDNAFQCIRKYGVCQENVWLYDINEIENSTDKHALSLLPVESCADINFQMLPSPQNVDEYKKILCGASGNMPVPIVTGVDIFTSGYKCNWLQFPSPGDNSAEGHAILIYGWKDTPALNSRGYFIAQNSLQNLNNDGSGRLKIPFEYIEQYALAAGTAVCEPTKAETASPIAKVDVAAAECIDAESTLQPVNSQAHIVAVASNFFSTIKENINKAPYFYPDLHMPFFKSLQINQVNVENVLRTEENCTDNFKQWLLAENITVSKDVSIVLYWFKLNQRSCWCLTCAFFAAQANEAITQDDIKTLQQYIKTSCGCRPDVKHFFFTLGTNTHFSIDCNVSANPTALLCEYKENNLWTHKTPIFERGQIGDEFLAHIMPGRYKQEIEKIIQDWPITRHITIDRIREEMGFSPADMDLKTLELTLDDIFSTGEYAKRKKGNDIHIIPYKLWNELPPGAKICKRYTTAVKKIRFITNTLFVITMASGVMSAVISSNIFAVPRMCTTGISIAIISLTGFVIANIRLGLKFKYNVH